VRPRSYITLNPDPRTTASGGGQQVLLQLVAEHDRRQVAQWWGEPAELDGAEDPTAAQLGGQDRAGLQVGPEALQQPQRLKHPLAVVVQHDPPTDPPEVLRLLKDGHLQAQPPQRQGRGEPGRPGPHDGDAGPHQSSAPLLAACWTPLQAVNRAVRPPCRPARRRRC
jgi:hypothetical protein